MESMGTEHYISNELDVECTGTEQMCLEILSEQLTRPRACFKNSLPLDSSFSFLGLF